MTGKSPENLNLLTPTTKKETTQIHNKHENQNPVHKITRSQKSTTQLNNREREREREYRGSIAWWPDQGGDDVVWVEEI